MKTPTRVRKHTDVKMSNNESGENLAAIQPALNTAPTGIQDSGVVGTHAQPHLDNPLPAKFDGANSPQPAELWPKWLKRFERYRVASGLKNKSNPDQVSILLYSMDDCADDILSTLTVDEATDTYDSVRSALNEYFKVRRHVICERARFNRRTQSTSESIDTFIQDLYKLSEFCDYGSLRDDLIRDRIVVGVLSDALFDSLQGKSDLSLKKAIEISRQHEARKQNREFVRDPVAGKTVNYVKPVPKIKAHYAGSKQTPKRHTKTHSATSGTQDVCTWCGRGRHDRQQCPSRDAVCGLCQKKGHFRAVCRSAKQRANDVHQLEEVDLPYLGYVGAKASSDNDEHWTASVEVDGHSTSFKLDTGAAVTVVSDREPWLASADLQSSNTILRGPGASHIAVIGVMDATLTYNGKSFNELIYVIQNQEYSLLSRRACVGLEMIARVDNVEGADRASDFRVEHPSLFKGIGKLKTEHHITLRPNSTPVCLYTARRIAHPLLPQIKSELQSMVR